MSEKSCGDVQPQCGGAHLLLQQWELLYVKTAVQKEFIAHHPVPMGPPFG